MNEELKEQKEDIKEPSLIYLTFKAMYLKAKLEWSWFCMRVTILIDNLIEIVWRK